jgi:Calcineurin-like phosphoesterase
MPRSRRVRTATRQPRTFADPKPGATPETFQLDSEGLSGQDEAQLQPVPEPRSTPPRMSLADVIGTEAEEAIENRRKITFHSVGDTGAVHHSTLSDEEAVSEAMTNDLSTVKPSPSFLYHLGDVVYFFGEEKGYYDQFYDPFRAYDRPILAIPGNHDGAMEDQQYHEYSSEESLAGFLANFCAEKPGPSPNSGGIKRETMDQPGAYFTLDAPFVSIIGLYTNVLEGPGIISAPKIGNEQVGFLTSELERLKKEREEGKRAVIVACHHPPVCLDDTHGGGRLLTNDLDNAFKQAGLWPDAVLSGHAHLYEHWNRVIEGRNIPYIVAGSGGYGLQKAKAGKGFEWRSFEMATAPQEAYGYLLLTVDMTGEKRVLTIEFKPTSESATADLVEVPLT